MPSGPLCPDHESNQARNLHRWSAFRHFIEGRKESGVSVKLPGVWADTVSVRIPRPEETELAHVELTLISINPLYVHPAHSVVDWPYTEDGSHRIEIRYGHL